MHVTPPLPLLKRVPPWVWVALAWSAGAAFTFLARMRLPGESMPSEETAAQFYRWDGFAALALATAFALAGSGLLRRRPLWALALLLIAAVIGTTPLAVGAIPLAQFLAVEVALYFVAASTSRRTGIKALAMALGLLVGFLTTRLLCGWPVQTSAELAVALTAAIAWLAGNSTRQAHEYAEELRIQAATQATTAERLRIARELHDMVAHSIGIIALQAGAAARVVHTQPAGAREAMIAVEAAGRETLAGLRRMLGALRQAGPGQAPEATPLHPMSSLEDVERLAAATTAAGVRVDVRWLGERRPLPSDVELAAFRIIQESVTNVVRHAGVGSCQVSIDCRDDALSIEVADSGKGGGTPSAVGYGLAGMRERVALLHGDFTAGPRPGGGFQVTARLPVPVPAGVR